MEIQVLDLVDEIRDFHPDFAAEHLPVGAILRVMGRKLNYEVGRIVEIYPDVVSEPKTVYILNANGATFDADDGPIPRGPEFELGWDGVFNNPANPWRQVQVKPFTNLLDSVRTPPTSPANSDTPVPHRTLQTQYPGPYGENIEFPALVPLNACFQLTDLRKVGFSNHGWQAFRPVLHYHAVPFYDLINVQTRTVTIAPGIRSPVILDTAAELAKRKGLLDLAAALEGQYDLASEQLTLNVSNVSTNATAVSVL
ncbi:MAG: hypothetical protein OXH68_15235 [Gammaproteobacteria bacterium]|nr:hypothetical protein [Gammaproteobacteria bacterium]